MKPGYRYLDHTADVGLEIVAGTLPELFHTAACGMVSLLYSPQTIQPSESFSITLSNSTPERLLFDWLREILYFIYTRRIMIKTFQVEIKKADKKDATLCDLKAYLEGEYYNPARHEICMEIKAVTRHLFQLKKKEDGWESRILFDV